MNPDLTYAVDRLYDSGWHPGIGDLDCETLPDGRRFPAVFMIEQEFASRGMLLRMTHHPIFKTYRATWAPEGEAVEARNASESDARHGTVIGSSEYEAAVYALAHVRELELFVSSGKPSAM